MALTVTEQLKLMSGEVTPPDTSLDALVHQSAFIYAKDWYDDYKEFDTEANPEAAAYLNKMFSVSRNVFRNTSGVVEQLTRIVVVIIGEVATDLNQVQNANIAQWETFIQSQIDEAFEYLSDVRKDEKTAYNAI